MFFIATGSMMPDTIKAWIRSEILDSVTCPVCVDLDGIIMDGPDLESHGELAELAHLNCRAIFVPIYEMGDLEPTPPSGIPDVFIKNGEIQLIDSWEDLPMPSRGLNKIAGRGLAVEEEMALLEPYGLMAGLILGMEEE